MLVYQRVTTKFFGYPILREIHELLVLSKLLGGTKKTHGIHHCPVHLPLKKTYFKTMIYCRFYIIPVKSIHWYTDLPSKFWIKPTKSYTYNYIYNIIVGYNGTYCQQQCVVFLEHGWLYWLFHIWYIYHVIS